MLASILVFGNISTESVSAYSAAITTSNSIELDITPSGDGTSIHSESINVTSDCRAGYNLTIATPEGSSLYKYSNNTQADTASFTAVDGTSALSSSNNTNKWGYTLTSNPTSSTVFSPLSSTAAVLKTPSQTASPSADINDTFNINYGAKVDNTVDAGTYQMANNGAIVYYLTMDTTCTQYTVAFNPNGGTGTMDNQGIEAGEPTNLSANTFTAPAFGSFYEDANGDTIAGTANTYWRFNGWNTAIDGTGTPYDNEEEVEDLAGIGSTITLYAQWEALSAMVVNFNTNGMEFEDGTTSNTLGYYHGCVDKYVSQPSYSHTANINDDGTQIGSTTYANSLATKEVVTIPNADSLHVTIKYGTEDNWDMLYVFQGEYTGSVTRNMNAGQLATYMGGNNTTTTVEIDIPGDTATFAFYSDSSGQYWGYHAAVVGYYDEEPESYTSTVEVCDRSFVYGEYKEPAPDDDRLFQGWSENSSATTPDYTSADDILNNLPGGNGDTKTLYAVWNPIYHITYVDNCMTYVSANASCTQSVSNNTGSQSINLNSSGDGSITLPAYNYNSWTLTGWKIKGWSTVADNSSGANAEYPVSSTYSVTGQGAGASITLYAHWVPVYSIQYDGNGADNPNGMGTTNASTGVKSVKQTNVGEGDPVTLLASNFKRAGYGFAGWSTDPDAWLHFTDNDNTNDPVIYGPMETISAPAYPNNGTSIITMYAVWVPVEKDGSNNPVYLQDFGKDQCDNLTSAVYNSALDKITAGSVMALTDKRDNEVYTIAKLADGKCWMIENLRVDAAGTLGTANELLSQGYGGVAGTYGSFVGLADSESTGFSATASSNTVYEASANPPINTYDPANGVLEDIGSSDEPARRFPRYNNSNNSSALSAPSFTENYLNALNPSATGIYKTSTVSSYGNYYTWSAAIANTGKSPSEAAETSICPSGWHLPSSVTTKEFGKLSQQYGGSGSDQSGVGAGDVLSSRFRSFPNNYIYSGYISGSSVNSRGSYGYYWSRSANNNWQYDSAQTLMLGSTRLNPSSTSKMYYGFSIRCIVDYEYTIQYDGNGADNPNGMGIVVDIKGKKSVKQRGITEGIDVMLLPSNFKRAGYGFVGWSTDSDAWSHFTDNDSTNDPVIYGPEETIVTPAYPANGIMTMYAVWVPAKKDGNNEPVYLQDFGVSECNNLTSAVFDSTSGATIVNKNSIVVLTDKRDNELYAVARLVDGKCWMIENLRLEHDGTMGNNINDSSVTNESLSQGYGGTAGVYGTFVGLAESEDNLSSSTTSNTVYKSSVDPPVDTYDPINNVLEDIGTGGYSGPGYRFPRYNNTNTHDIIDSPTYSEDYAYNSSPRLNKSGTYGDASIYSYGNYYTWSAAMANTNDYNSSVSENANTSICPTNWHLPSSGSWSKEYGVLAQGYGGATNDTEKRLMAFPNNFIYAGDIPGSSIMRRGSSGSYWSRSASNSGPQSTYSLEFGNTSFGINYITSKYRGVSVRCLVGS